MTVGMVDEAASGQQAFQLHMNRLDITMIPIGDIHYIENRQCEDAVIVGSFSNTDPGVELTLGVSPSPCTHAACHAGGALLVRISAAGMCACMQPV